jgi:hypothetical protein
MFTQAFSSLPLIPKKQVLKMMIGSLNSSVIGYVRSHIRSSQYENSSRDGTEQSIDKFNEALSQVSEREADAQAMADMGLGVQMPSIQVAEHLNVLRHFLISELAKAAQLPSDVPLTIEETLTFQITRTPDINEPALRALAKAVQIDFDALKTAKVKMFEDDRLELIDMQDQISDVVKMLDAPDDDNALAAAAEEAFDALPVQIRYKLVSTLARNFSKAGDKALGTLLRFNRLEAAGDIQLIKAAHAELVAWLAQFSKQHGDELNSYIERGGQLPEVAAMT